MATSVLAPCSPDTCASAIAGIRFFTRKEDYAYGTEKHSRRYAANPIAEGVRGLRLQKRRTPLGGDRLGEITRTSCTASPPAPQRRDCRRLRFHRGSGRAG